MKEQSRASYDAIIVGAGVIGAATAFELAKKGWKTLNVDKLPAAGYGSTSNSCAIVRAHYSTFDGVAMAYEGFSYWKDWSNYLESEDERGHALYMQSGTVLFMLEGGHHEKVLPLFDQVGVPYEILSNDELRERYPFYEHGTHGEPCRPEDDRFWDEPEGELIGALYTPDSGYVSDPQLASHNLQRAAEAKGGSKSGRQQRPPSAAASAVASRPPSRASSACDPAPTTADGEPQSKPAPCHHHDAHPNLESERA